MDVDELKNLLFEMLEGNGELFSDLSLDDETDTIFIKSVDGERFIVTVSPVTADETLIELWAKKESGIDVSCPRSIKYEGFRSFYRGGS